MSIKYSLPIEDLEYIFTTLEHLWDQLRNKKLLITGGTGFFGIWFLESFLYANSRLDLNAEAYVITRDLTICAKRYPHLSKAKELKFIAGDIKYFKYPSISVDYIIHAASGGSLKLNDNINGSLIENSIEGTRHVLEYARNCKDVKMLYTSSGAVYGKQPSEITHIKEDYIGAPDTMKLNSSYGESKRICEMMCSIYGQQYHFEVKIARCFAFVGPYLPLQSNYAIGNFIYSVLNNDMITITGDGTPRRSYLYSSDLTIWLWKILFNGTSFFPYNVGADNDISILELAQKIKSIVNPICEIKVNEVPQSYEILRYVPSVERAYNELGLMQKVSLNDAIIKTSEWYKSRIN